MHLVIWYEILSLLKPRLHGMMHYTHHTSGDGSKWGLRHLSGWYSYGSESDLRSSQGGPRDEVLNPTLLEGGGTHERLYLSKGHYLGIGYGMHTTNTMYCMV